MKTQSTQPYHKTPTQTRDVIAVASTVRDGKLISA